MSAFQLSTLRLLCVHRQGCQVELRLHDGFVDRQVEKKLQYDLP